MAGYIQISPNDARYVQWSDGSTFRHLGVQGDDGALVMSDPFQVDQKLPVWASRNVTLLRVWGMVGTLTGSDGVPWAHVNLSSGVQNINGNPNLVAPNVLPTLSTGIVSKLAMQVDPNIANPPAIAWGFYRGPLPCKPNMQYTFTLTARTINWTAGTGGVRLRFGGKPDANYAANLTTAITGYVANDGAWHTITATYTTQANQRFFEYLYAIMDNFTGTPLGQVAEIRCQETATGLDLLWKSNGNMHKEFAYMPFAAWRYACDVAASNGLTLRIVSMEAQDPDFKFFLPDGTVAAYANLTASNMTNVGSTVTVTTSTGHHLTTGTYINVSGAAGFTNWAPNGLQKVQRVLSATQFTFVTNNGTTPTGTYTPSSATISYTPVSSPAGTQNRWLQKAAARRLAAGFGDKTAVHSWELFNEAGSNNPDAYLATGAFAKEMQAADAAKHLVAGSYDATQPFRPDLRQSNEATFESHVDIHAYISTMFSGQGFEWDPPSGTTLETNTANTHNASPGAIKVTTPFGDYGPASGVYVKGQGTWNVSVYIAANGLSSTNGPRLHIKVDNPAIVDTGTARGASSGTYGYSQVTGTFSLPDANWHQLVLSFDTGAVTAGTVWFDDLLVTDPSGNTWRIYGSGNFDDRVDMFQDTAYQPAVLGTIYGAKSVQGVGKMLLRGETGVDSRGGPNTQETAQLVNDTHGVWIHNLLWGALHPGGLYDIYFWSGSALQTNNLWFQYSAIKGFLANIPLQNGKYQDIVASQSGQTNGSVIMVGQKDLTNNKAHLWVRHNAFNWYNAVNNSAAWQPASGNILTGTVSFSGLANGSYSVSVYEFDATGSATTSTASVSCSGGVVSLNLGSLRSTTTDVAFSLSPGGSGVAIVNYRVAIRDSTGALRTALTPTFLNSHVRTDAGAIVAAPTVTELNATDTPGIYIIPFDPIANGDCMGVLSTGLSAPYDKLEVSLTQEASRVITNLDAQVSTRATPAQILATPANLLATDSSGRVTVGSLAAAAISAATFAAGALGAVWDELRSAHVTAGTMGQGVASVTGSVGSVSGSVGSVTSPVDILQTAADKVWVSTTRTVTGPVDILQSAADKAWNTAARSLTSSLDPTAQQVSDYLMDTELVETGMSFRMFCRGLGAVLMGLTSGGPTGTVFRAAFSNSKPRVTSADDVNGNRSNITYDLST